MVLPHCVLVTDWEVDRPGFQLLDTSCRSNSGAGCEYSARPLVWKTDSSPVCPCPRSRKTTAREEHTHTVEDLFNLAKQWEEIGLAEGLLNHSLKAFFCAFWSNGLFPEWTREIYLVDMWNIPSGLSGLHLLCPSAAVFTVFCTHPLSVAIVQRGPVTTVVTEGHKVGRHEILTKEKSKLDKLDWICV